MAYKIGDKMQLTLFPNRIDDYVGPHDPVRVYDAFVDALDFGSLGILIEQSKAGADEYYPKQMLKLFVYGCSYGFRSSRKLERACEHNVSFMWLMNGLKPDYRTIARFRKKHKEAIKKVLKQCVSMCLKMGLIEGNTLFIDGSKFRANASINNIWTKEKCEKHLEKTYERIDKLIDEYEQIDQDEEKKASLVRLKEQIEDKEKLVEKIKDILNTLKETDKESINSSDPECVKTSGRQGKHSSYNVQAATDQKHGLIVQAEAVSQSNDVNLLSSQIDKAKENLGKRPKQVCADSGYFSTKDLKKIDKDIKVIVPTQKQARKENGRYPLKPFDKEDFKYDKVKDEYICPEGKTLKFTGVIKEAQQRGYRAKMTDCQSCPEHGICTTSKTARRIVRLCDEEIKEHLEVIYASPEGQNIYKFRKERCEHPFGHMKRNLAAGQFMLRGKAKVDAEVSILATCFNISRMITLIGIPKLILRLNELKDMVFFAVRSIKSLFSKETILIRPSLFTGMT